MSRCPEGHQSAADDYCDVCGTPMTGPTGGPAAGSADASPGGSAAGATPGPAGSDTAAGLSGAQGDDAPQPAKTQACPHCAAPNSEDNLFCEVCGFDFTTGVMPRVEGGEPSFLDLPDLPSAPPTAAGDVLTPPDGPAPPPTPPAAGPPAAGPPAAGPQTPATPSPDPVVTPTPEPDAEDVSQADAAPGPAPSHAAAEADDPVAQTAAGAPAASPAPTASPAPAGPKPVNRPPSREVAGDWVVEVWIDPDWFAEQDTDETCPSPAPPEVVRLTGSDALIGRRSRSSVPDIDCGVDSAVSRRQALLTSDGRRWWVEDLDSSNGTWVAPAIGPLPSAPIAGRTEVDADDRIYVGAWTRLVVRAAVGSEVP